MIFVARKPCKIFQTADQLIFSSCCPLYKQSTIELVGVVISRIDWLHPATATPIVVYPRAQGHVQVSCVVPSIFHPRRSRPVWHPSSAGVRHRETSAYTSFSQRAETPRRRRDSRASTTDRGPPSFGDRTGIRTRHGQRDMLRMPK